MPQPMYIYIYIYIYIIFITHITDSPTSIGGIVRGEKQTVNIVPSWTELKSHATVNNRSMHSLSDPDTNPSSTQKRPYRTSWNPSPSEEANTSSDIKSLSPIKIPASIWTGRAPFSNSYVASATSQLILQPLPSLHLRHSSFYNPSVASSTVRHRHFTYLTWRAAHVTNKLV